MFVAATWAPRGVRHGHFQWCRRGLILPILPAAVGSGANGGGQMGTGSAMGGGSASAHLCVIASGAGQISTA